MNVFSSNLKVAQRWLIVQWKECFTTNEVMKILPIAIGIAKPTKEMRFGVMVNSVVSQVSNVSSNLAAATKMVRSSMVDVPDF